MVLEYTITVGSLIQSLLLIAGAVAAFYTLKSDVNVVKHDLRHIQESHKVLTEAFTQLGKVLTQVAVQDNRLNMIEKNLDELRHGKGIVKDKS